MLTVLMYGSAWLHCAPREGRTTLHGLAKWCYGALAAAGELVGNRVTDSLGDFLLGMRTEPQVPVADEVDGLPADQQFAVLAHQLGAVGAPIGQQGSSVAYGDRSVYP